MKYSNALPSGEAVERLFSLGKNLLRPKRYGLGREHFEIALFFVLLLLVLSTGRLHMTSYISRQKKWLTKSCNLCWKGIGRTPTFGFFLKTNEKLIKNWIELLLFGFSETNKFNQKQFGLDLVFQFLSLNLVLCDN